jgi:hypothetical protein
MNQRPGNEMRTTNRNFSLAWTILLLMATAAAAQTDVTTINGGNPGTIPVFTTNTHNIENSVITQSTVMLESEWEQRHLRLHCRSTAL